MSDRISDVKKRKCPICLGFTRRIHGERVVPHKEVTSKQSIKR
jgi:hypothetical protein